MRLATKFYSLLAVFSLPFLLTIAAIGLLDQKYKNIIPPNIYLNQTSYAQLDPQTAQQQLENTIQQQYTKELTIIYNGQQTKIPFSAACTQVDQTQTIQQMFDWGKISKHKHPFVTLKEQLTIIFNKPVYFKPQLKIANCILTEDIWQEIAKTERPINNFSYRYQDHSFVSQPPQEGKIINREKLTNDLYNNLITFQNTPIQLEFILQKPTITTDKNQQALNLANNFLTHQVYLEYQNETWEVPTEELGLWIDFIPEQQQLVLAPNYININNYLINLVPQINHPPVNAQLEVKNNKVTIFTLSQAGTELDLTTSNQNITQYLFTTQNYQNTSKQIKIPLQVNRQEPAITSQNINNMGITSLLATGESNFTPSSKSRKHNITVGANKFNGILIAPQEKFSFNQALGEVNAKEGYLSELVIKKGQTVSEFGGGLCQVSTTAFRAAVKAGLEIVERRNHAYAVKYYSPQGTDAAIYPPHPDLVFINNTPAHILIQTRIVGNMLYFDFYGTDDGRKVELEGPVIYERGAGGAMKTYWKEKVYNKEGDLIYDKVFYSDYKSPSLYPQIAPSY